MLRKDIFAVWLTTLYLFSYCVLLQFVATQVYAFAMLLFSPLILCWMIYTVLKHGIYTGPELGDKEFGYLDK